jgi:Tfp pilus assembly protein PilX
MVTMKTLSSNRGVALIVLIVAMTLIAILGTSFVSLIGSKQKGFLYQIDSYRALNIANAGVEYAIRYASDGLDGSGDSIFFSDPDLSTIGKSFGGGAFSVMYNYSSTITSDNVTVTGIYGNSSRQVKLSQFRRYISPITLIPSDLPRLSGNDAIVPVISNNENNFTISHIDVTIPTTGGNTYLDFWEGGTSLLNYAAPTYPPCDPTTPVPICKDTTTYKGIYIAGSDTFIRFDLSSLGVVRDTIYNCKLHFSPAVAPAGQYTMKIYTSLPLGNSFTVQFSLP